MTGADPDPASHPGKVRLKPRRQAARRAKALHAPRHRVHRDSNQGIMLALRAGRLAISRATLSCPKKYESRNERLKPRFHSQRVEESAEDDGRDDWGGSQYERSEREDSAAKPEGEDPDGSGEGFEIVRSHGM